VSYKRKFSRVGLLTKEAADATGVSESVLRSWETRYGWPVPPRHSLGGNQIRIYPPELVEQIKRVAKMIERGDTIGSIVAENRFIPPEYHKVDERINVSDCPTPKTPEAQELRSRLVEAIYNNDHALVEQVIALSVRIHPAERALAVHGPLDKAVSLGWTGPDYKVRQQAS
jgi:DNA-binding transcriptional MerR regulator